MRYSIEVEYWVIDEQGRLTEPGALVDASPGAEREFVEPLLEIKTTPCANATALREEFFERVGEVLAEAQRLGKGLVPLGTPVYEGPIDDLPKERTQIQDRAIGENFDYVRHCAGTHIHVEQRPGREIDQLNTLIALDPALALVNSSPYFEGEPLAASARSVLYRRLAYEHLPRQGELWPYVEDTEEWARRLERRYESFVTEAVVAGCERETVESCFTPESAVWTPVKLRAEFGTVEWRSPDAALPSQIVRLADDVVGIVERLGDVQRSFLDDRLQLLGARLAQRKLLFDVVVAVVANLDRLLVEVAVRRDGVERPEPEIVAPEIDVPRRRLHPYDSRLVQVLDVDDSRLVLLRVGILVAVVDRFVYLVAVDSPDGRLVRLRFDPPNCRFRLRHRLGVAHRTLAVRTAPPRLIAVR